MNRIWINRFGTEIDISTMSDDYLENAYHFCVKQLQHYMIGFANLWAETVERKATGKSIPSPSSYYLDVEGAQNDLNGEL